MIKQFKVGIAGYGVVGKKRHYYIDQHPNLKTIAVCDRTITNCGQLDGGIEFCQTYQELLTQEIDILFVCMSNDMAAEVTLAGLAKGLHVFCEKPPGRDVHEIAAVINCEKMNPNAKLVYGFNHRYHHSVRDALALVKAGQLGKVVNIKGTYGKSKLITFNQSDWRTQRNTAGGGVLLDQGIHMVDLLRLFVGEFEQIHSFISNGYWRYDVEDNAYALMKTKSGVVAMLHSSATHWRHRFELDITLERGSIILGGILSGSKSYGAETLKVVWASEDDSGDPREQITLYNKDPSWEDEIKNFAKAIIEDIPITSASSHDAYQTMLLVYRIYCADPIWREQWALTDGITPKEAAVE